MSKNNDAANVINKYMHKYPQLQRLGVIAITGDAMALKQFKDAASGLAVPDGVTGSELYALSVDRRANNARPAGSFKYDEPKKKRSYRLTDTAHSHIQNNGGTDYLERLARGLDSDPPSDP